MFGKRLTYREIALLVSEIGVSFLQVQRNRIVQSGLDPLFIQVLLKRIAIIRLNNVQVEHRLRPG